MGKGGERVDKNGQHISMQITKRYKWGEKKKEVSPWNVVRAKHKMLRQFKKIKREKKIKIKNIKTWMTAVSPSFMLKHRKNGNNLEYVLEHNNS